MFLPFGALVVTVACVDGIAMGPNGFPQAFVLSSRSVTMTVGERDSVLVRLIDQAGLTVSERKAYNGVAFASSNMDVARVSRSAVNDTSVAARVDAVGAGNTTVTATYAALSLQASFGVTVQDVVEPPTGYPNLPAGLREITTVSHANIRWEGFNDPGPAWIEPDGQSDIQAIHDPSCPAGDSATVIPKDANHSGAGAMGIWFNRSPYNFLVDSLYIALYMYRDASFSHAQKFYYNRTTNSNAAGYFDTAPSDGDLRFFSQHTGQNVMTPQGAGTVPENEWWLWETLFVMESSSTASDGEFHVWSNGDLLFSMTSADWVQSGEALGFAGMSWRGVSDNLFPDDRWYKVCGLTMWGK